MKKILLLGFLVVLLSACSDSAIDDSYSAYRHKTAAQLYQASSKQLKKHDYDSAVKNLEALNALYPFGAHAQEGQVNLIYAYYRDDEPEEALAVAERYLRLYPRGRYADYAYYMKGLIATSHGFSWLQRKLGVDPASRDISGYKQAFMSFNQLVRNFPKSQYVPDALIRMRYIRNVLAKHELQIASFYYNRKAYVAAVNRATGIVSHYDRSPSVIPALAILVKSYRALGLKKMESNTLAIFKASYPNSKVLKQLQRA